MLRSRRANAHLLVKFNALTSQRLLNWNPVSKFNQDTQKYFRWVRYSQSRSRVPVANELMNSLMRKWFRLLKSIDKMNNLIFIFSLDSIIECLFDYSFFKNYTFHKSTSEFVFSLLFFLESSAGEFWSSNPNKLLNVRYFVASDQCKRPDLLENTMVKLRSVYVRWLLDFDPRPFSVSLRLQSVNSSCYFD